MIKKINTEGGDDLNIPKSNRPKEAKLPGVVVSSQTKNLKPSMASNLYQSIATHFTMQLSKYTKDESASDGENERSHNNQPWNRCENCRNGGSCPTKELEDQMREVKQAIIDLANGIKECKDRIGALEDNRKLDIAQINEKWNV